MPYPRFRCFFGGKGINLTKFQHVIAYDISKKNVVMQIAYPCNKLHCCTFTTTYWHLPNNQHIMYQWLSPILAILWYKFIPTPPPLVHPSSSLGLIITDHLSSRIVRDSSWVRVCVGECQSVCVYERYLSNKMTWPLTSIFSTLVHLAIFRSSWKFKVIG